jgi:hypothetical protein
VQPFQILTTDHSAPPKSFPVFFGCLGVSSIPLGCV